MKGGSAKAIHIGDDGRMGEFVQDGNCSLLRIGTPFGTLDLDNRSPLFEHLGQWRFLGLDRTWTGPGQASHSRRFKNPGPLVVPPVT